MIENASEVVRYNLSLIERGENPLRKLRKQAAAEVAYECITALLKELGSHRARIGDLFDELQDARLQIREMAIEAQHTER
jgi:Arc/MetJ-type ribon-helix-helix transcriptional regulator